LVCELCELKKVTKWHFECEDYVILDCDLCCVPMVVFRSHEEVPEELYEKAKAKCRELFGEVYFRMWRGSIPDHPHFHVVRYKTVYK
jgi:hypothetical protein